jgi:hypothetical protein
MAPRIVLSLSALLVAAAPATAQLDTFERMWPGEYDGPRRLEFSVAAGYAFSTDWSERVALQVFDPHGGVHQQVLLRNVSVAPGAGGAAAVTYWRGRHGFRVSAGYSSSCLTTSSRCANGEAPPAGDAALAVAEVPLDVWRYGIAGIVGLRNWEESRFWRPYLVVGAGGVTYDPDADALPLVSGSFETVVPRAGTPGGVVITDGHTSFLVATSELGLEHVFGLTLGVGMDLRMPVGIGGVGLRLEVADQMTSSPFSVRVARLDSDGRRYPGYAGNDVVFRSNVIHNLRLTAGIMLELGLNGPREEHDPSLRARRR